LAIFSLNFYTQNTIYILFVNNIETVL